MGVDVTPEPARGTYNPHQILATVAAAFGLTADELGSGRRTRHRAIARSIAVLLLRESGHYSWSDVARILGYRDHTSALLAYRRAQQRLTADPDLRAIVDTARHLLGLAPLLEG